MLSRVAMPNRLFKYKASRAYNLSTAKIHGNRLGTQAIEGRHSVIIIKYFTHSLRTKVANIYN